MSDLFIPEALNEAAQEVVKRIESYKSVLPSGVVAQQFIASAVGEVNALKKPVTVSWQSAVKCVYNCAMVGLIPGAALGHAYFIPRKGVLNLELGYRGLLELAFSSGFLIGIHAQCVLTNDEFSYKVTERGPVLEHHPSWDDDVTRQNLVAAYVVYQTKGGWHGVKVVSRKEIDKVDTKENVWSSRYKEMVLKTPTRRAAKEWRQTSRMGLAIRLDEQAEADEPQESTVDLGDNAQPSKFSDFSDDDPPPPIGPTAEQMQRELDEADALFAK